MSASTLIIPSGAIVSACALRDAIAKTNPAIRAAYTAAHQSPIERGQHEFVIEGVLGEALVAEPVSTTAFLNLSCPTCARCASFQAARNRVVLIEDSNPESDAMLLARSANFVDLVRQGLFDSVLPTAAALASDPVFDVLIISR
jgi:hypothetical protein